MMAESQHDDEAELAEENVKQQFEELCRRLNMDSNTQENAWSSYSTIKEYFNLEVR